MADIHEIATRAGVSISTVSRVIRDSNLVHPDTKERVLEVLRESNYKPNVLARRLRRREAPTDAIGLILPTLLEGLFETFLTKFYQLLRPSNAHLILLNGDEVQDHMGEGYLPFDLRGVAVVGMDLKPESRRLFLIHKVPVISLGFRTDSEPYVRSDGAKGGWLAASHLASRNCSKILYVGTSRRNDIQSDRYQGFIDGLRFNGIDLRFDARVEYLSELESVVSNILKRGEVEGIFCLNDEYAYAVLRVLKKMQLAIPLVGYGDYPASELLGLSSVGEPAEDMVRSTVEFLLGANIPFAAKPLPYLTFDPVLQIRDT